MRGCCKPIGVAVTKAVISLAVFMMLLSIGAYAQQPCDVIYVAPGVSNATGFPNDPTNLVHALSLVSGTRQYIRMLEGSYTISNVVNLVTNVKIDGGYRIDTAGVWEKRNDAITSLFMTGSEVVHVGAPYNLDVGHSVGFKASGINNWSLQDLTINISAASGTTASRGNSVYGVHIDNCNGYTISRCVVFAGAGSAGSNGDGGSPGYNPANDPYDGATGANGVGGGGGNCDDDNLNDGNYSGAFGQAYNGDGGAGGNGAGPGTGGAGATTALFIAYTTATNGNAGGPSTAFRSGGGGGAGGTGGSEDRNGGNGGNGGHGGGTTLGGTGGNGGTLFGCVCNAFGCPNSCGFNGSNGQTGFGGSNGADGAASNGALAIYFIPGDKGSDGNDGAGGGGGSGAGGGGGRGAFVTDGAGAGGGGGGGGGQGGIGGHGAYGGGSSIGIYSFQSTGTTVDCNLLQGLAGPGGTGGSGGVGGNGGTGAVGGQNACGQGNNEIGAGGTGGNGGQAGDGGKGGNGANGVSYPTFDDVLGVSIGGPIPTPSTVTVNYNNTTACTNSEIIITKFNGNWVLPVGASFINDLTPTTSSYNNSSPLAIITFNNTGSFDLGIAGGTLSRFVNINDNRALPVINSITASGTLCTGSTINLNTISTADEYEWLIYIDTSGPSVPLFTSAVQNPGVTPVFSGLGHYYVRLREHTICCGWSAPVFMDFTVVGNPTVDAGSDRLICGGTSTALYATGSPGNYTWSDFHSGQMDTVSPATSTPYSVTVTDANNCTATDSVNVTVSHVAVVVDSFSNLACFGAPTGNIYITPSGDTSYTFQWSNGISSQNLLGVSAGTYIVTVTNTDNCTATASATLAQPALMTVNIIGTTNVTCNGGHDGSLTTLVTGGSPPYSYGWSDGSSNPNLSNAPGGNYTISVNDANGCQMTAFGTVAQPTPINATPTINNLKCFGDDNGSIVLSVTGGTQPFAYQWNTGSFAPAITGLLSGNYVVTISDTNNCVVMDTFSVTSPPEIILNATAVDANCAQGGQGSASVAPVGGVPPYIYSWTTSPTQTTATASALVPGTYSIRVKDANDCIKDTAVQVNTSGSFDLTLSEHDISCAAANDGVVTAHVDGGRQPFSYQWSNNPQFEDSSITGLTAGAYGVTVTDANGCSGTANTSVAQQLEVTVDIGQAKIVGDVGLSVDLKPTVSRQGTYTYTWIPTNGISDPGALDVTATPLSPTLYTIRVTETGTGCTGSDSVDIIVSHEWFIPNAFTPNGDALNNTFGVVLRGDTKLVEFRIYNRYGQKVFDRVDIPWDGKVSGADQPTSTFVYEGVIQKADGSTVAIKGDVTLIR